MPTQREILDTNAKASDRMGPTLHANSINRFAVVCSGCGGTYYADEKTYFGFARALEFDACDDTFMCVECEARETDEEHR